MRIFREPTYLLDIMRNRIENQFSAISNNIIKKFEFLKFSVLKES